MFPSDNKMDEAQLGGTGLAEYTITKNVHFGWERIVSNLLSPPVVWTGLILTIAFRYSTSHLQAILCAAVYNGFVCLAPLLDIIWMIRRGSITDIHMKIRRERLLPFFVSILSTALTRMILQLFDAPTIMLIVASIMLAQLFVMALITLVWQISFHTMSITGAVVTIAINFGTMPALLLMPLIPLVGVARLRLQCHTLAQIVAGILIGGILTVVLLALF
jgi:hypothetical protein